MIQPQAGHQLPEHLSGMFERLFYAMMSGNPMAIHNHLENTSDQWIPHPRSGIGLTGCAAVLSSFHPTRRLAWSCDDAAMSTALQIARNPF